MPLHPRTSKLIDQLSVKPLFTIIEPVGYFDMLQLLHNCSLVITDSGGLQKEAYFFKKFCVIMREQTEWKELVEHGFATIAGSNKERIILQSQNFISNHFTSDIALYGDGKAGKKIATILENYLN